MCGATHREFESLTLRQVMAQKQFEYPRNMKENKISILINKPISEVFSFTINPINTAKWIEGIEKEEADEWPIKIGSTYKNVDTSGKWTEYTLTKLKENKIFELTSKEGGYHVRYVYTPVSDKSSILEYFEWVDEGDLGSPFSQEVLERLKDILESSDG